MIYTRGLAKIPVDRLAKIEHLTPRKRMYMVVYFFPFMYLCNGTSFYFKLAWLLKCRCIILFT